MSDLGKYTREVCAAGTALLIATIANVSMLGAQTMQDTGLYVLRTQTGTLRMHGDTVWSDRPGHFSARFIQRGDTVWMTQRGTATFPDSSRWLIRGQTATATIDGRERSVGSIFFRADRNLLLKSKRMDRVLELLPPSRR